MVRQGSTTRRTRIPYIIFDPIFTNSCFVDQAIIDANRAGVLKASFENDEGETIVVHVATAQFFELHRMNEQDMDIWEDMNLNGFFNLPAWGLDYMRAYQALTTLNATNDFTIIDLQGVQRQFPLSADLIRHALSLAIGESLTYDKMKHIDAENNICLAKSRPTWMT